ncbi:amino acid adenylation domain-containing protein [Luteimonas aestuarii]|uniref:Amino acid adenylation domain-containing protein n=1 Tax=Luteimonas aestuarii TaxID=453837 RepID=A0A4R5U4F3_9GAMM|nr:amino acid adenylation domain-containing protein [Luteimonas aestuarii]TDK28519.1 amino acid adenylation domain-containing protein [Luteimonas aestuarii]
MADASLPAATECRVEHLVRAQAIRTPDALAAESGNASLTYRELLAATDRVAAALRARGVGRGTMVGIHLERSLDMLVALLAVMQAGGTYIPLDPDFPPDRLQHMVSDSSLSFVLTQSSLAADVPGGGHQVLAVEEVMRREATSNFPVDACRDAASGCDLAYVLYTSGSTGLPKGVAIEHRSVVNFLRSMQREPGMGEGDRLLAVTTLSFDIAGLELYLPLIAGGTVVIATRDQAMDGDALRALVESRGINILQATPSSWRLLLDAGWQGDPGFKALCGGEPMPLDLAHALAARCGELWNLYGPTETTIWSTLWRVPADCRQILVGKPIANTRIHVLDKSGRRVPVGIPGEICIGGDGVGRGYLHRDELTAERFVPDPFSDVPGARLYRTGDQGRLLPDGNLECRGRLDSQVKIRGYRIELGEIEQVLLSAEGVARAVVIAREDAPGDVRLVGYVVVGAGEAGPHALFEHVRGKLPGYMVPQHLVVLDAIPLLPNGKVDRKALPAPASRGTTRGIDLSAASPALRYLVATCAEVIGDAVAPDDNFFDAGGHSMLAIKLINRVQRDTGMRLNLLALASSTLSQLAEALPQDGVPETSIAGSAAATHA